MDKQNATNSAEPDRISPKRIGISDRNEIERLADGLASEYEKYLRVNTNHVESRLEDSVEECLTHLEEIVSVLDSYQQESSDIPDIVAMIASRNEELERLYEQVDSLEQYLSDTNQYLDELDVLMSSLESDKKTNIGPIRQIIDLIPRLSIAKNVNHVDTGSPSISSTTSNYKETLRQMADVRDSLSASTARLLDG